MIISETATGDHDWIGAANIDAPSLLETFTGKIEVETEVGLPINTDFMNSEWPGWILIIIGSWINPCFLVLGVALLFFRRKGTRSNPVFGDYSDKVGDAVYTATFEDGIYQVGGHKQVGVAYAVGGVLHTCRHVTGGGDIIYNGRAVSAYQESLLNDTVCYGGPWQLEEGVFKGDESVTIAVKDPTETSVYVYKVRLGFTSIAGTVKGFIGHDFGHGTSGSPIFKDGKCVGLYGFGLDVRAQGERKYISWIATDPVPIDSAERSAPSLRKAKLFAL